MTSLRGLDDLDLTLPSPDTEVRITRAGSRGTNSPVAIIGMSGRAGAAESLDEFFSMILQGEEAYRDLPAQRRADVDAYLAARGADLPVTDDRYIGGTRMSSVSDFDHRFFSLSPQEAKTIDPNQRIFLETSWAALEDSGYLGAGIGGEKVGVYVGMSADFGEDYRAIIQAVAPEAPEISVAGNIRSIIASRIAYLLDLRGPAMLIDTACSSGLVAAYTAYRAIQNGECTMALVGAVKCDLLPIVADESGIGIKDIQDTESEDHHTRTFDRNGDGTSAAEGSFAFVLKALDRAQRDGDTIRAVIMGGAVNQDGASNGITAPNAEAQADLIEAALTDAGITAEQISYVEAHGTATKLGDPVEISGIERAFSRQTSRRQFCGIGTVKTNIGHMDNASGLAGLAKLVMSLERRMLPASLNFEEPNPNIDFTQTPVYVNDRTVPWSGDGKGAQETRETLYAGINSFGLSGTNCHLIVRSADPPPVRHRDLTSAQCFLLPLSARDPRGLTRLAERYRKFLTHKDVDLADLCFTASVGRRHHRVRAAFVFGSRADVVALLERFVADADDATTNPDVSSGEFRLVLDGDTRDARDITAAERDRLSEEATGLLAAAGTGDRDALRRLASRYVRGAEIDWRRMAGHDVRRIPLPTYPFERVRCWIDADRPSRRGGLLDGADILRTVDRDVCVRRISPENLWELSEHRIHGVSVLPGTGLVEMIVEAGRRLGLTGDGTVLRHVQFAAPLAVPEGQQAEVHVTITTTTDDADVTIASRVAEGPWVTNATAVLVRHMTPVTPAPLPVDEIRQRVSRRLPDDVDVDRAKGLEVSDRWTGSLRHGSTDPEATEILYELELPAAYRGEVADYVLHPALFDALINAPSNLYDDERLYLPFSYGVLTIHEPLPAQVVARFTKRPESIEGQLYAFDVRVADPTGRVVLTVDNYCIKSAVDLDMTGTGDYGQIQAYRKTAPPPAVSQGRGTVLLCGRFGAVDDLRRALTAAGYDHVHIPTADGEAARGIAANGRFAFAVMSAIPTDTTAALAERVIEPVDHMRSLLTLMSDKQPVLENGVLVLTRNAFAVTGEETGIDPGQAGVMGMMRVAALEYTTLRMRCVDHDEQTDAALLVAEATSPGRSPFLLYRDGQPYEPYLTKHPIPFRDARTSPPADGVTVVSGGTGDLGTAVAQDLARQGVRRLVLLGSPDSDATRETWADIERDLDVFEVIRLDLGDRDAVEATVRDIRARHGRISGVFHLAGRPGAGYLYTKSRDEFMDVYRSKALGGVHLHQATLEDDLDTFVMFSSISGLGPTPGQADYTAANLLLDSLAHHRRREDLPALSIQWPAWRDIGIAKRLNAVDEEEPFVPLGTDEAVDLLRALVAWDDHPPVLMPGRMRSSSSTPAHRRAPAATGTRQVVLYGLDGIGDVEQAVAEIWAETLDVTEVDAYDEFSDLGGNSLLTSQMLKLYDERFPDLMDITDLFRYTTIADHVACLRERLETEDAGGTEVAGSAASGEHDIDRLLDLLEQGEISVHESQGLL